jgi:DNA processing protein
MVDTQEKIHQIALSLVKGVGATLWRKLVAQAGSAQAVFHSDPHQLTQVSGASKQLAYEILKQDTLPLAEELLITHQQKQIQVISIWEQAYPERLKNTPQAPPLLYFQGNVAMNSAKIISIVGTRKATHYGRSVVEKLVNELKSYQVVIVSGLAYGIDISAHQEALKQGLPTIGVLAGNLDFIYPVAHKKIAADMLAQGGLVSENPLQADLEGHHFPARNRIIAGMADATIVVEANQKSGALITAGFANAYHREVFAVPGGIDAVYSRGPNELIKNHQAHLITSGADVAYIMGWDAGEHISRSPINQKVIAQLTLEEQGVIQVLQKLQVAVHLDELSYQTQIPLTQLAAVLLQLELKNIIQCLPGNKFKLVS